MKNKRLLKTIVGLAIAFAMTFTPFSGSYALLVNPAGNGDGQVTETQATDAASEDVVSEETEPSQPEVTTEESEPAEQAEPELNEDMVPVDEVAEKAERTEYIWKDEKVKVTAVLSDAEAIPDDAELVAKAVTSKSDDYDYDAYMEALNKNSDSKYNAKNTLLYDVAFMKDGVEIQPESGTVSVTFEFLDKQLSKSIGAKKASDVNVIHLPLKNKIRDKYDTTADAKNIDANDIVFEELTKKDNELAVSVKNEKVQFETSEFSVYAYTVDFEYTDPETGKVYTYNLEGAGSITLKELAIILGITKKADADEFIDNVENVTFSNENLLKVKKTFFRGWVLKSLAPFSSEELLTITMRDGKVIKVKVTDAQTAPTSSDLSNFLSSVEISAPKDSNGKYIIVPGENYLIDLSFAESSTTYQFPNDGTAMTYRLPMGLEAINHNGSFPIKVRDGGQTYTVSGNTYSVQNGVLTVHFNTSDPNFSRMAAASNLQFGIELEGGFREDIEVIEFNDEIIKELVVDNSSEVTASKSATVDTKNDKVNYTVAIVSKGKSKNIVVKDTISDPKGVLSLDATSIRATSSTGQPVSMTGGANGNSFSYTISEMKNGEIITFTYSADIDVSKIPSENGKYIVVGNNEIEVTSDEDPEPDTKKVNSTIDYTPSIKKDGSVVGPDGKTLTWTITANEAAKVSMAGGTITDTIKESSRQYMKYSGDGISVQVYNANGTLVDTRNIGWSALENKTDSTWTYRVPESDAGKAYKYVITYTTEVDVSGETSVVTVENDVHTENKDDHGSSNVTPPGGEVKVYKSAEKVDLENKEVTWNISFTVPESGLTEAVVTDLYPRSWVIDENIYEVYKENSISVSGLIDGEETYDVVQDTVNKSVVITFYKDSNKSQPGLQSGSQRTVYVTLKTEINEKWLEAAKSQEYLKTHTNTVNLTANGKVKTATASVIVAGPSVDKTATVYGTRKVGDAELPVYRYEITLSNVNKDENVIVDTFDRELLEPYTPSVDDAWYIFGGGIWYQGDKGASPVSYVDTTDGIRITTSASSLPHSSNSLTHYYDKYKLVYYLTVKDAAAMNKIMRMAASADDGKYKIKNKATWNDEWDGAEIEYEYPGLSKEILNPGELHQEDDDVWVKFRITANSGAQMLNGGQPIEIKDTVENLSIDITSIKVEKEVNGSLTDITASVPHDMSGNTMTYQIPDSTKVIITYDARVTFPELDPIGENKITFRNNVKMLGYEKEVHDEGWRTNNAQGTAEVYSINLMKYQGGNINKRLKGAVFALLDSDKNPVVNKNGEKVQYETGDDGIITVRGDQDKDGWTLQPDTKYYLREIKAPPGFMLLNSDYQFTISKDGSTDYSRYLYHNGDTMSAKNYRGTDVFVKKTWSDGYEKHESDSVTVKLQQKIGNGEWSDTIRWQNRSNNYAWEAVRKSIVLNKDNDWKGEFRRLPLDVPVGEIGEDFDEDSAEFEAVEYRIVETKINDYIIPYGPDGKPTDDSLYKIDITAVDGGTYIDETGAQVTIQSYNYTLNNTPVEEEGSLKIRKTVKENGQAPSDAAKAKLAGTYTFTLYKDAECSTPYNVDGRPKTVTLTIPETGEAAVSDEVTGLPAGDYWIKETDPTNGSTPVINPVKVKVVAGKTGDEAVIAQFTNNLTGIGEIKVKKELNGRAWTDTDEFTFTLTAADGTPMPKITSITIKKEDEDQTKSFGEIKFTEAGTYTYTVTETEGSLGGVTYNVTPHTVTIEVVDDGNGNLVAKNGDSLIKAVTITNTYKAKGTAEVEVAKHLVGKTLEEGTFTFTISAEDNAPMNKADGTAIEASKLTVTNGADEVAVKFPTFHYTLKDAGKDYYYKIVEDDFNIPGVSRDTETGPEQIYVKITVGTDKGDGTLTASTVKYYSDKACTKELQKSEFINKYDATGSISLKGTKKFKYGEVDNETGAFKETFTFSVYKEEDFDSVNDRNSPAFILNMKDKAVSTASTADIQVNNGKVSFDFNKDLEYTLADIVGGEKTAAGYWTKEFHYVVVEDIPATAVKKTVDGKDFYYDSSIDSSGKQKDIKYDATVYPVTITVTDTGKGTLAVKRGEEEGPLTFDFENEKIYTKLLLTKDIDKYVTGDTKGELTNVTCVFKVKYKDPILGRTVTRTVSVQFDAQHVSAETAEVDKIPIEDPDKTFQVIEVYSIDYAGKVIQGKELKRVDQATGLPIWTVAFENEKEDNNTGSGVINKVEKGDDNNFHITNRRDRTSEYPSPTPQGND